MRVKVIGAVLVYNGKTYHEGDYVEVENEEELEIMVQEQCVSVEPPKKEIKEAKSHEVRRRK